MRDWWVEIGDIVVVVEEDADMMTKHVVQTSRLHQEPI
jgi:hypothetical protein